MLSIQKQQTLQSERQLAVQTFSTEAVNCLLQKTKELKHRFVEGYSPTTRQVVRLHKHANIDTERTVALFLEPLKDTP